MAKPDKTTNDMIIAKNSPDKAETTFQISKAGHDESKTTVTEADYKRIEEATGGTWDSLGIENDFIFCKVMQDEDLLAELVRVILPDLEFTRLEIQAQKSIETGQDIHGVRFDIYAKNETGDVIDMEMQLVNKHLSKRLRFYGSIADTEMLEKGMLYSKLRDCYIILIGMFDPFGMGYHRYTFTNRCSENSNIEMKDGMNKIFLNAIGTADDVNDELKAFLDYVGGGNPTDEYTEKLDTAVKRAKMNKEWRREYMTQLQRDMENKEEGRMEGREEGREEGRTEGRNDVLNELIKGGVITADQAVSYRTSQSAGI